MPAIAAFGRARAQLTLGTGGILAFLTALGGSDFRNVPASDRVSERGRRPLWQGTRRREGREQTGCGPAFSLSSKIVVQLFTHR